MAAAETSFDFRGKTCSAPAARTARMAEIALRHIPDGPSIRVLDVGCGTGSLLFRIADARPRATLLGLDISAANIRAAEAARGTHAAASRIGFTHANYLAYRDEPFDTIVSDGVLHLIPGDTTALFAKLARDLWPGGMLVCGMPFDCAYNRAFALIRRGLRLVRSRALDQLILIVAKALHGREMDDQALRERIDYMYFPPTRMADRALRERLAPAVGLRVIAQYPMKSTSLSQLRYNVTVFERASEGDR